MTYMSKSVPSLQPSVLRLARIHFAYVFIFAISIAAFDAWQLIAPEDVLTRWTMAAIMLVVTTIIWYIARTKPTTPAIYKALVLGLVLVDIAVATTLVYSERGMASRAVALYAVPIVVSAVLMRSSAVFAAASLSTAAYTFAAIRYFVINFNEGYKIELYAIIGFYSAMFFVFAALLSTIIKSKTNNI